MTVMNLRISPPAGMFGDEASAQAYEAKCAELARTAQFPLSVGPLPLKVRGVMLPTGAEITRAMFDDHSVLRGHIATGRVIEALNLEADK